MRLRECCRECSLKQDVPCPIRRHVRSARNILSSWLFLQRDISCSMCIPLCVMWPAIFFFAQKTRRQKNFSRGCVVFSSRIKRKRHFSSVAISKPIPKSSRRLKRAWHHSEGSIIQERKSSAFSRAAIVSRSGMKDVFVPCLSAALRFLKPQGIINSTHKRPLCGHCAPALTVNPANRVAPALALLGIYIVEGSGAEGTVSDVEAVART
jgi:hypothetical protein